ncbi:M15 family metallopeptidase [Synechococcus sp. EJ6-Ellesmere]|uniref:M15 family metallopeptidase n=1 Tax=Synechococcus sp. EJ6-Ellesmere TaxID=2823734 RepID=UPI0020CF6C31|nr:M15 family metallopeptidase [Synechococcus sp. EJ6-Ellesmere]MCP9826544.1 M15 family metallopeptidase [Synechococcus sp. EJ6-Ellesmere]
MSPSLLRPWSPIPIQDTAEPLIPLPREILRLEPHPYVSLGAPYGDGCSPFQLRSGVVERLLVAQGELQRQRSDWCLAIFDGWRPVRVQQFMVEHTIESECRRLGLDPRQSGPELEAVTAEVGRFWAPPSLDPATPPPHSTGGAVDLTLATSGGEPLDLGGEIDAIGAVSEPDHYDPSRRSGRLDGGGGAGVLELEWHGRRSLLREVMAAAGFAQHPNEWWHFSHGDQLWAWRQGEPSAIYGGWDPGRG